jgi:hypothetical protein
MSITDCRGLHAKNRGSRGLQQALMMLKGSRANGLCAAAITKRACEKQFPRAQSNPCRLPAARKKLPDIRSGFPCRRGQGIFRKPLRQQHKIERKSSGRGPFREKSLQNSLRAGIAASNHCSAIFARPDVSCSHSGRNQRPMVSTLGHHGFTPGLIGIDHALASPGLLGPLHCLHPVHSCHGRDAGNGPGVSAGLRGRGASAGGYGRPDGPRQL